MKTRFATAILTVIFLSAGTIAGSGIHNPANGTAYHLNLTVIAKNQSWPLKNRITMQPCAVSRCIDI